MITLEEYLKSKSEAHIRIYINSLTTEEKVLLGKIWNIAVAEGYYEGKKEGLNEGKLCPN